MGDAVSEPARRPIRCVLFCGSYLEPGAVNFVVAVQEHPEIQLIGGFCQGEGSGSRHRLANLWRRRRWMALPILLVDLSSSIARFLRHPRATVAQWRIASRVLGKLTTVPDVHDPDVLAKLRDLEPDLGLIYGAPILKPELFEIPTLGTLGIHHGRVPEYRGKKTTFWEMYNGERVAGVTIQRVNRGIDTGDVVERGEVLIGHKSYSTVQREVEQLGLELYIKAILDIKEGRSRFQAQDPASFRGRKYRQPTATDILRFWNRRIFLRGTDGDRA